MVQPEQIVEKVAQQVTGTVDSGGAEFRRIAKEVSREARKSPMPVFIAALAAFLALVSMANGDADKLALKSHLESTNQFAYFQAKNIRKTDSAIAADMFRAMSKPDLAAVWQAKADKYSKEKAEILKSALAEQAQRKVAIERGNYYEIAVSSLQIAIVLASASMFFGGGFLLAGSILLAIIAAVFTANGFGLYFQIPTNPVDLFYMLKEASGISFAS